MSAPQEEEEEEEEEYGRDQDYRPSAVARRSRMQGRSSQSYEIDDDYSPAVFTARSGMLDYRMVLSKKLHLK